MTDILADALDARVRQIVRAELAAQRAAPVAPRLLSVAEACVALGGISRAESTGCGQRAPARGRFGLAGAGWCPRPP